MEITGRIQPLKVAGVVGHEDQVAFQSKADHGPILQAGAADMRHVIGLETRLLRFADECRTQALVYKEFHASLGSRVGTTFPESARQPRHGCFRGLPRRGCAAA